MILGNTLVNQAMDKLLTKLIKNRKDVKNTLFHYQIVTIYVLKITWMYTEPSAGSISGI